MRKLLAVLAGLAMSLAVATASGADKLKVGFIYVGPIGDHGWTYQHDQGRLAVEEAFGDKVETVYVENVAEGPDAERAITRLARDGAGDHLHHLVRLHGPDHQGGQEFPGRKFEHGTGYKRSDNVTTYSARFYEGRYVIARSPRGCRRAASRDTSHRSRSPRWSGHQLLHAGRAVRQPGLQGEGRVVSTWFDPGKEADAAKVLNGQGADIITQHTDSTAPLQIAAEQGWSGSDRRRT